MSNSQAPPADLALLPPPAIWSRVLIWTLGAGSFGLLLWSVLAKVEETIILPGEISTVKPSVQVSAADSGLITSVMVKQSQRVVAGQVLFTYEDDDTSGRLSSQRRKYQLLERQHSVDRSMYTYRMNEIEEQIRFDRQLLQRLNTLRSTGAIQEIQVIEKEAQISKAYFALRGLREEMIRSSNQISQAQEEVSQAISELRSKQKRFVIKSPVSGTIQELKYQFPGERVQASDTIALIVPEQILRASVRVPSKLSAPISIDTPVVVDVDAYPSSDYGSIKAVVASVSPTTSQATAQSPEKSYSAELSLLSATNPYKLQLSKLRPGMAVTVKVRLRDKPVIATVFDFLADLFDPLTQQR
jgi:multidrug efflux pump subunit AcrA (membrane-fusion protein)